MNTGSFTLRTNAPMEMVYITEEVQQFLAEHQAENGFCFIYNPHTTAGITINEGADPAVRHDIINGLKEIVPMKLAYRHREGNSPSHIMSSLIGCSTTVVVDDGNLLLGTWQRIFFCEFDGPRTRTVHCRFSAAPF